MSHVYKTRNKYVAYIMLCLKTECNQHFVHLARCYTSQSTDVRVCHTAENEHVFHFGNRYFLTITSTRKLYLSTDQVPVQSTTVLACVHVCLLV